MPGNKIMSHKDPVRAKQKFNLDVSHDCSPEML